MTPISPLPRRTHRKKISALRLSSDTTSTLPEYIAHGGWQRPEPLEAPSDLPPDYPDSAEEADEDTDSHSDDTRVSPAPSSPRRSHQRRLRRKPASPGPSSADPYLDSLLERSVHALEMSNALLQSSISTHSGMAASTSQSQADATLEQHAIGLSSRFVERRVQQQTWADDLEEISRGVETLFDNAVSPAHSRHSSLSSSLPTSVPSELRRHGRRPSLNIREALDDDAPHLRLEQKSRSQLISPPPRALTQYVESTLDADTILLPSTLGLRSASSTYNASASSPNLLSPALDSTSPPSTPATRAYNMLSSFVYRPSSSSGSSTPSTISSFLNRAHSMTSAERGHRSSPSTLSRRSSDMETPRRSRSQTPRPTAIPPLWAQIPPIEELSSSSSSDSCRAKQTVSALRKILDDHQPPPKLPPPRLPPPPLLSRPPLAEASTSTATASISRLFTKATHSSSTRAPPPPRQSALKQSSTGTTPSTGTPVGERSPTLPSTPMSLSIPDILSAGVSRTLSLGSRPGSRQSTNSGKRISFAELPESYASSRPEGSSSKFQAKKNRRSGSKHSRNSSGDGLKMTPKDDGHGWLMSWIIGGSAGGAGPVGLRHDDRMEDRMGRGWHGGGNGSRMGALDDWTV